jgi:opacity protein-like surface antigen
MTMRKGSFAIVIVMLAFFALQAGAEGFGASGFIGFGKAMFSDDDFEDELYITDWEQASYFPGGLQLHYAPSPKFHVGAEVEFCLGGFNNDGETIVQGAEVDAEYSTKMTKFGAFGRFLVPTGNLSPFVRAGLGFYSGKMEEEISGNEYDYDLNSGLGFNFGGGLLYDVAPNVFIGMEGTFHIVSLEAEADWMDDEEKVGLNHLNVRALVGASF